MADLRSVWSSGHMVALAGLSTVQANYLSLNRLPGTARIQGVVVGLALHVPTSAMIRPQSAHQSRSASSLNASFDTLMRRVEHSATLRERQAAVDTLFDSRRGMASSNHIPHPPVTCRNLP